MRTLKLPRSIEWSDLPRIESPLFALNWVKRNVNVNGFGVDWVAGLKEVIVDERDRNRQSWDQHAYETLQRKIKTGQVFLLQSLGSEPNVPLLRRVKVGENETWEIDGDLLDAMTLDNAQRMLRHAIETKGVFVPQMVPSQAAPASAAKAKPMLTVTSPRWKHRDARVEEQRPDVTHEGDRVFLEVDVNSAENETKVEFEIVYNDVSPAKKFVVSGRIIENVGTAEWIVTDPRADTSKGGEVSFQFTGRVRKTASERAELPVQVDAFVSFIPMVFTTRAHDRANAIPLPEGRFLYIFRNGKLEREFTMQKDAKGDRANLKEIDLRALRKKFGGHLPELRKTGAAGRDYIRLPYAKDGKQEIEVAVSPVQWSAAYIEELEGSKEMCGKRTELLDCADFDSKDSRFKGSKNLSHIDQVNIPEEIVVGKNPVPTGWLRNYNNKGTSIGLAYLQDPVGVALLQAAASQEAWAKLQKVIDRAKTHPHFDTAVIAYQLLFNDEVRSKSKRNDSIGSYIGKAAGFAGKLNPIVALLGLDGALSEAYSGSTTQVLDSFDSYISAMKSTDLDKLEKVLESKQRRELREKIRQIKKQQVEWLEGAAEKSSENFVLFNTAILDYFCLSACNYHKAFEVMAVIMTNFPNDPSDLDAVLTLPDDRHTERGEDNPGYRYMEQLVDPEGGHPLHKMCFPTEEQVPICGEEKPSSKIVLNDGSGAFRVHALDPEGFAETAGTDLDTILKAEFRTAPGANDADVMQSFRRVAEFSPEAITAFASLFTKHWTDWQALLLKASQATDHSRARVTAATDDLDTTKKRVFADAKATKRMAMLARSLKASNLRILGDLRLVSIKNLPADHVIIGLNVLAETGPMSIKDVRAATKEYYKQPKANRGTATILDGVEVQASEDPNQIGISGKAGKKSHGKTNIHQLDMEVVSLPRDLAIALDLEYLDVQQLVEFDRTQATAGNSATSAYARDITDRQNELAKTNAELAQHQSKLDEINGRNETAQKNQFRGERLAKAAKGTKVVAMLFNVWNTASAFEAAKSGGGKAIADFGSAVADLAYALGEAADAVSKNVKLVRSVLDFRLGGANLFRLFGAFGAGFSVIMSVITCVQEVRSGDSDAGVAQGIMAIGFGLAALNTGALAIATASSGTLVTTLAAGPVGWIALGIILVGAVLYMLFNDTDLERWAKNGPFAKSDAPREPELAWLADGAMKDATTGKVDGFPAFEYLVGTLFTPTLAIKPPVNARSRWELTPDFVACVGLPVLFPHAKVEVHADVEEIEHRAEIPISASGGNRSVSGERIVKPRKMLHHRPAVKENKEDDVSIDEEGILTRNYYYTTGVSDPFVRKGHGFDLKDEHKAIDKDTIGRRLGGLNYIYRVKARLSTGENGLVFPIIPRDANGVRLKQLPQSTRDGDIDTKTPGWVYATKKLIFTPRIATWSQESSIVPEVE